MRAAAEQNRAIIRVRSARARSCVAAIAVIAVGLLAPPASGQGMGPRVLPGGAGGGGGIVVIPNDPMLNPDSPEARAYAAVQRERRALERELRLIKRDHFGAVRVAEKREIGIRKLRAYTSSPAVMAMIDVFDDEEDDVRESVLDHFSTLDPEIGLTALAWEAVRDDDAWYRGRATELLAQGIDERAAEIASQEAGDDEGAEAITRDPVPPTVRGIIADALQSTNDDLAIAASDVTRALKLYELIPLMATAQVAQRPAGSQGNRDGDLGWIMIGQQTAFVADLQPVVANNAVAFDPQIGVVSDGVLLRISDAVVTAVRTPVHRNLVGMTTDAWGRPTGFMGYDPDAWRNWYDKEFVPSRTPAKD